MTNPSFYSLLLFFSAIAPVSAFLPTTSNCISSRPGLKVAQDIDRPSTFLDQQPADEYDPNVLFIEEAEEETTESNENGSGRQRWENLNPKLKQRLIEKGQQKAIANKKKREPAGDKKRRMLMQFKKLQQEKKRASRVERPLAFDERAPLSAFFPGMEVTGVVISLTNFGAYIDVGTVCDGLLHISQITRDAFIEHPRQAFTPGDEVTVKVRSVSPELKKMHLTMLSVDDGGLDDKADDGERISLSEIEQDDELWGVMKRVTDFGAYVEVGAEVDGFLHFMDHPSWDEGAHPSKFMEAGQRVRVWVSDRNLEQRRIKLTGNRPTHLPGPRLEF